MYKICSSHDTAYLYPFIAKSEVHVSNCTEKSFKNNYDLGFN